MEQIQLEAWLVETSGGDLGVSPNLTGKILLQGRGGQEAKGSKTENSEFGLCPCPSPCADGDSCALHDSGGAREPWAHGC